MPVALAVLVLALLETAMPAGAQICAPDVAAGLRCLTPPASAPPCPPSTATVDVTIDKPATVATVSVDLDGQLVAEDATCAGGGATTYTQPAIACGEATCHVQLTGLRPGAWINRIRVQPVPGFDVQRQAQRLVFAAGAGNAPNQLGWTVYAQTFMVRRKADATDQANELLKRLRDARLWVEGGHGSALITFHWNQTAQETTGFPGACDPREIELQEPKACDLDDCAIDADAAVCWPGSGLVLDALDRNAEPGGVILSGARIAAPLLRVSGRDNVIRGLHLRGNTGTASQRDTLVLMGPRADQARPAASGNRLEDLIVEGPGQGDAISAQCGSFDNVVVRGTIRGAEDKGVKVVEDARLTVEDACVADNANGGIQATRGGHVVARRSLLQMNLPGPAANGIWARGVPGLPTSSVATDANIVRFSGARGLSATDDATADFRNDYVAHNQYIGARVETTAPCSTRGPAASFAGVGFVCNGAITDKGAAQLSGTCTVSKLPCTMAAGCCPGGGSGCGDECKATAPVGLGLSLGFGAGEFGCCGACTPPPTCSLCSTCTGTCATPAITLADGANAFVRHPVRTRPGGAQLEVAVPGTALDASGNQWEGCVDAACPVAGVSAPEASVQTTPIALPPPGPPTLHAVLPHRPARGDLVRIWGEGFDAVGWNPGGDCWTATPPTDHCDPVDCAVAGVTANTLNGVSVQLNGVRIRTDVYAVTPTMIAFRMPVDCFANDGVVWVQRNLQVATLPLCDLPVECAGLPDGTRCDDDGQPCTADVCEADACVHLPGPRAGTPCRAAAGVCDAVEACDGVSPSCPADGRAGPSTVCRPATSACDAAETCNGVSLGCPPDGLLPAGATCRPAAGLCDRVETCDGISRECPADVIATAGAPCRPAAGDCDVAEGCDGASTACPPDAHVAAGTTCRPAAGPCDAAEACDGTSASCPDDARVAAGTVCRPASDACDAAESCDGETADCPVDAVAGWGTPCRAAADPCDTIEYCDGRARSCPPDAAASGTAGARCRLDALRADVAGCSGPLRRRDRVLHRLDGLLGDADAHVAGDACRADRSLARAESLLPRLARLHAKRGSCLGAATPAWRAALDGAAHALDALRETLRPRCARRAR